MNIKNNQRTRITKIIFHNAYLSLLSEMSNEKITVRALCEKAELNRSTFYIHYAEPNDILKEIEDEQIDKTVSYLEIIGKNSDSSSYEKSAEYTLELLRHIRENDAVYSTLLLKNRDTHFRRKFQNIMLGKIMEKFDIPKETQHAELAYQFIVAGSMELIENWISNRYSTSEETIRNLLFSMARGSLVGASDLMNL